MGVECFADGQLDEHHLNYGYPRTAGNVYDGNRLVLSSIEIALPLAQPLVEKCGLFGDAKLFSLS
ncbi:hypothetical protein [Nostoc sp.]